ncbi:MAG TPA: serine/threonine-protein kinase, partial [Candidatus Obscuribacterales bacterium]
MEQSTEQSLEMSAAIGQQESEGRPAEGPERAGAYVLGEKLSSHQNREVFLAQDGQGSPVIVKRLRMGQIQDWKALDLFEREAKTLQTLQHPRIPRLLDFYHEQPEGQLVLTMVMEYVAGPSLAQRLKSGWRPPEAEVLEIARQGLEILAYLHEHAPAVIHRDLKPSNLIWTDAQELYLIDFGAVRDIFISKGSSTVIGTFGYMAPEQFAGQTVPASDLYGLGATLLHLISGRSPSEIPQKHLMPDFRPYVSCSVELQRFLEQLLVPDLEERLPSARAALDQLKSLTRLREDSPSKRLVFIRDGEDVRIQLRPNLSPVAIWNQHRSLVLVLAVYLMGLSYFYLGPRFDLPFYFSSLAFTLFFVAYGATSSLVFVAAIRQLVIMAREQALIRLTPAELILEKTSP